MPKSRIEVRQATPADLDILVPLFDAYRQFYRQASEPERARHFLEERFALHQSVIFLAFEGTACAGFTQLYPSFSSGALARIFILNDLFVAPEARRRGVGTELLQAAAAYGRGAGALRLVLSTEVSNTAAQTMYERAGWRARYGLLRVSTLALNENGIMDRVRMDKWLWAARFFKTRALAAKACELGRIESNGQIAKPAREVRAGDQLLVKNAGGDFQVEVLLLSEMRGPAAVAQTLYRESQASRAARLKAAEERKAMLHFETIPVHKPTKRDRRKIDRFRGRG